MSKIEQEFNQIKRDKDWGEMGNFFWRGFVASKPDRRIFDRLWDSLTKKQQQLCEG